MSLDQEGRSNPSDVGEDSFEYIVVGAGVVGAASAYYLSQSSSSVAVIASGEPEDYSTHDGPFASHYDSSRFYRTLDPLRGWALAGHRSSQRFRELEQASGIEFHKPVGNLRVWPPEKAIGMYFAVDAMDEVGREFDVTAEKYSSTESLANDFPYYSFPDGVVGYFETGETAGVLDPRKLIAAHLKLAGEQGAAIIDGHVVSVESEKNGVEVKTKDGHSYIARKVLLATGGWTNSLLKRSLSVTLAGLTVLMSEVSDDQFARLDGQPPLIYRVPPKDPFITLFYKIPAMEFPDGKQYLKQGLFTPMPLFDDVAEVEEFFQLGGSEIAANVYRETLKQVMPDVEVQSSFHKPCMVSITGSHYPYIDTVEPGVYVAAFGNGSIAKSSDEFGRLIAGLVETGTWDDPDFAAEDFAAVYSSSVDTYRP